MVCELAQRCVHKMTVQACCVCIHTADPATHFQLLLPWIKVEADQHGPLKVICHLGVGKQNARLAGLRLRIAPALAFACLVVLVPF